MADSYGHQPASPEISPHSDNEGGHYGSHDASVREQDRFLPIANVSRIMKKALPSNAKISKDAKETVQECVSEFISFITGVCVCGFWLSLFGRILTFRLYVVDSCILM
jgi:nuclear transcription Y subunit beta